MSLTLIELTTAASGNGDCLAELNSYLAPLRGEIFRFFRVSYGYELTVHFGALRPARSEKLQHLRYGAFILGVRASQWALWADGASNPRLLVANSTSNTDPTQGRSLTTKLENGEFLPTGCRVSSLIAFSFSPTLGFGLEIEFSEGSVLKIFPTDEAESVEATEGSGQDAVADWELFSPHGFLRAGPGDTWSYDPKTPPTHQSDTP
jgi:hypothetical protein